MRVADYSAILYIALTPLDLYYDTVTHVSSLPIFYGVDTVSFCYTTNIRKSISMFVIFLKSISWMELDITWNRNSLYSGLTHRVLFTIITAWAKPRDAACRVERALRYIVALF